MSLLDGLRHRFRVLLSGERYTDEVAREMRFHLELDQLSSADRDCELNARKRFGNITYYREEVRRMSPLMWFDGIRQDVGYAWRGIRRSPSFTLAVVLTLGLGIGVNAAIFSFLDRVFSQPPEGVVAPEQVRRLYIDAPNRGAAGERIAFETFRYPQFRALSAIDSSLQFAGYTTPDSSAIISGDSRIPLRRSLATGGYFDLLGVKAQRGRFFLDAETRIETPTPVAIISDAFWERVYNRDESVIGKTLAINTKPYTIIGVASAPFTGVDLNAVDVWLPFNTYGGDPGRRGEPWYDTFHSAMTILVRVPPGTPDARITTAGTVALRSVHMDGFSYDSTQALAIGSIIRAVGPGTRSKELTISTRLAGVAIIVLFIACANVANLLLVRSTRRQREIALRRALGVSRRRLYEQLLTESVLFGLLGGVVALLFALWGGAALRHLLLPSTQWARAAIDLRAMLFILGASVFSGILAGLAPSLHAFRADLINSLKAGSREGTYKKSRLRSGLLVVQTALSLVLIAGAGLFVRSFQNIRGLDVGYDIYNTLTIRPIFYADAPPSEQVAVALNTVAERLRHTSGVEAAATGSAAPMAGYASSRLFLPGHDSLPALGQERGASTLAVSSDYFRASGVALIEGREFQPSDTPTSGGVVIVSRAMANLYWPGESALGKCLKLGTREAPCSSVVGVVADVRRMQLIEPPTLQFYTPLSQSSAFLGAAALIIRTPESNVAAVSRLVSQELRRAFPSMAPPIVRTVAQGLDYQIRPWRLGAQLFTALGLLALCVAAIGVYSVVAYTASQRTHELGIRVALGADARNVISLVLGEGVRVVLVGIVIGVVIALAAGKLVSSLLYDISPRDPFILVGTAATLALVGIAASAVPGWRASKVDPVTALRAD